MNKTPQINHKKVNSASGQWCIQLEHFLCNKMLKRISNPLGWYASPSQGNPLALDLPVPIYALYSWAERGTEPKSTSTIQ